jgi:hypothetical protein
MSEILNDDDDPCDRRICMTCVAERYLSADIEHSGEVDACFYCGETAPTLLIEELAERVETAFEEHYVRTPDQPDSWQERMLADRESDYVWERDGYPVLDMIVDAAEIPVEAAEDVLAILQERHSDFDKDAMDEESEFAPDSHYDLKGSDDSAWQEEWNLFERYLKTQARFFSYTGAEHLAQVFGGIDLLQTNDGLPVVVDVGPGTTLDHLFRARVFQSDDPLKEALRRPDRHLGSPPSNSARAGRMNAQGIAVFYGATDAQVAIAEVRAPVGSRVAVAKFNIARPLRLLDLTGLEKVHEEGSVFDPSLKRRLERATFVRTLGSRMARPVMPNDEALDYLPTQAVADFLATMNEPRLDGIVFSSAQTAVGRNVVLFHHAAKVAEIALPDGTEVEAYIGSGNDEEFEINYWVAERVPRQKPSGQRNHEHDLWGPVNSPPDYPPQWDDDFREPALHVEPSSIEIHHVASVEVHTDSHRVHRHRQETSHPEGHDGVDI